MFRNAFSIEAILEKYVDEKDEVKKCKKIIEKSLDMFKNVKEPEFDFLREIEFLPDYEKETIDNIFKVILLILLVLIAFLLILLVLIAFLLILLATVVLLLLPVL